MTTATLCGTTLDGYLTINFFQKDDEKHAYLQYGKHGAYQEVLKLLEKV